MFKYFINAIFKTGTDAIISSIADVNLSVFSDPKAVYKLFSACYSVSPVLI